MPCALIMYRALYYKYMYKEHVLYINSTYSYRCVLGTIHVATA